MRPTGCALLGLAGIAFLGLVCVCVAMDIVARNAGSDFLPWESSRGESVDVHTDDPVALGEALYQENCSGCHSIDGSTRTGPSFQGLYGSEVTTEDGQSVVADENHIRTSITDPGADIREGYPKVMPSFDELSDEEIDALIAFIQSLE